MSTTQSTYAYLHPFTSVAGVHDSGPHVVTEAKGVFLKDADGNELLDAMAGLWCVNAGYGREEIVHAIAEQAAKLSFYHGFQSTANEPSLQLAARLAQLAPGSLNHVFFGNSGSDANDTNIKIIWYYNNLRGKPEKKKFIGRDRSYHGVTLGAGSLSGLTRLHEKFDLPLDDRFIHVTAPHHYREAPEGMSEREFSAHLAKELEERIHQEGPETIAAFIAEPVMGAGGVVTPPDGYFDAIVPILKAHDILFIADEVVCGFGRVGSLFGCVHYGFQPDIITVAKALTCGYVPLSASIISDEIWDVMLDAGKSAMFQHGFTYSGHPVSCAAGLASMDCMEKDGWADRAKTLGGEFQAELRNRFANHPLVGEIRGEGLIAGVELVANKENKTPFAPTDGVGARLHQLAKKEGLITRAIADTMAFSPPLVITREEIELVLDRFMSAFDKLEQELRSESKRS
jgi:L-2,4-diaminobutyrate transaminase